MSPEFRFFRIIGYQINNDVEWVDAFCCNAKGSSCPISTNCSASKILVVLEQQRASASYGDAGIEYLKPAPEEFLQKWPVSKKVNISSFGYACLAHPGDQSLSVGFSPEWVILA
jgi:hypothetical protein